MTAPLLEVRDLKKHFPLHTGLFTTDHVHAVDGISFHIDASETLSLVGEFGCGKSTAAKAILRLFDITAGEVILSGRRIDNLSTAALRPVRKRIQVVFQDPFGSLNPRLKVRAILAEPIRNFGLARSRAGMEARIAALLEKVRLPRDAATAGRTNSPAGSVSASASRARLPPSPI